MKTIAAILAVAVLAAGCVSGSGDSRGARHGAVRTDDAGVRVRMLRNGIILLYNRKVTPGELLDRLKEEHCDRGAHAVIVEGGPGTDPESLLEMRTFLVKNRIPRVILAMPVEVTAETLPQGGGNGLQGK